MRALIGEPAFRVLEAVVRIAGDGWPVSVREAQAATGASSPSTTHAHLMALERRGLIETSPRAGRANGYRPTPAGVAVALATVQ